MPAWSDRLIQFFGISLFEKADKGFYNVLSQSEQAPSALDSVLDTVLQKSDNETLLAANTPFSVGLKPSEKTDSGLIHQERSSLNNIPFKSILGPLDDPNVMRPGDIEFGTLQFPGGLNHLEDFKIEDAPNDRAPPTPPALNNAPTFVNDTVIIDTVAPTTTVAIDSIDDDTGTSSSDFITKDDDGLTVHATLSTALLAGEILEYSNDGGATWSNATGSVIGTAISHVDGTLTSTNTVKFRVKDEAGNTGTEASQLIIIDTIAPLVNLTFDDNVLSLNAPDHTFETEATRDFFDYSAGPEVRTVTDMSFNNGNNVQFNDSGATDVIPTEGVQMLGMRSRGKTQAQIETDLGVPLGTFDAIDPDGGGPKGTLNVTDGSYAQTVLYAKTGDVIKFDWNFLGVETGFFENIFNDVVFVVINGVVTELTRSTNVPGAAVSGWQTFNYTATEEGPVEISFALFNVADTAVDSGFTIDNFKINDALVQKQPVELNINLEVTDETAIDPSDVLITISGVDLTSTLSAGTNIGGGVWELSVADLEGLTMTPPDASTPGYTGTETLTITVNATDEAGNITTVIGTQDIRFEILDNTIMGTSADETLNGLNGVDDYISGRSGDDTLNGGSGNDFLDGGSGNDTLLGEDGRDILLGGKEGDILTGGNDDDVYVWLDGDEGSISAPATDRITDFKNSFFSGTEDDHIDLSDLLSAESHNTLTDYLFVEFSGGNSTLYINTTGAINGTPTHNADQVIIIESIDLTGGSAIQADIINSLVNNNVIVTDSVDTVLVV